MVEIQDSDKSALLNRMMKKNLSGKTTNIVVYTCKTFMEFGEKNLLIDQLTK